MKKNKPNWAIRMFYAMLTDPSFSFDYFNRDQRSSIKKGAKKWKIMSAQLDYMMGRLLNDEIVIASGRSVGKCQKDDSKIMMRDGTYKELKELINTRFYIQSYDEQFKQICWTQAFAEDNGKKECFDITLDGNFKTSVTKEHPFLTNDGWKPIHELNVGDYIVQPEFVIQHDKFDNTPSDNELKLVGYLLGDGCISNTCDFTNINSMVVNEMRNIVKDFNCTLKKKSKHYNKKGNYRISTSSTKKIGKAKEHKIRILLRELGIFNTTSHTKFIPDKYLKCSNEKLAILINRLFTCDGWYSNNRIGYCTVSEKMMKQVQLILLRFGIRATYVKKYIKYKGSHNLAYQMNISSSNVRKFYEKIGIFTKLTNENTIKLKDISDRAKLISLNDNIFNELKSKQTVPTNKLDENNCRIRNMYKSIDINKLKRYLNVNNIDESNYEYLWTNIVWTRIKSINSIGIHPTVAVTVPETSTHIIDGVLSHNTSSVEHMLFSTALTFPKKWSAYVVPNMRHATVLQQHLVDYFNKDSFTREMFVGYDKKERIFTMNNGHKIEIRIVGHDKTGSRTLVSGHYDFLFIDEAQLLPKAILNELIPAVKEGGQIVVTGVPNDIRDSVLYHYVSSKDVLYYRYASYESEDWDEHKAERAKTLYGGTHTPNWRNLVEGLWGDHASSVFRPSKLVDSLIANESFVFKTFNGNSFDDLYKELNLPILRNKYQFYIIGGDMGYTSNSPSHLIVLGAYDKKDRSDPDAKPIQHYDVVYRLEIENMASFNMAKTMNYLIDYFNCKHFCIDTQTFGHQVYDHLIDKEIFPATYRRNKMYTYAAIFTRPVVMGVIETVDQTTGLPMNEEIRYAEKVAGTNKMAELVEDGRFHIAHSDSGAEDFDDLVTIMMAETQTPSMRRLHPFTYSNSINDHATDALRCCALIILQVIEKGLSRYGYNKGSVKPARLGKNIFKPARMNERRKRFHD